MPGEELPFVDWRARTRPTSTPKDQIVDTAISVLDGLYVHRKLKQARHHTDPIAALQRLRECLSELDDRAFHDAMLEIHKSLDDVHTAYRLPDPYYKAIAFLPFIMKSYVDDGGERRYVVARSTDTVDCDGFEAGAEIVRWNGTGISEEVRQSTLLEEGSSEALDLGLGLLSMTVRWLGASFEPRADRVTVDYHPPDGSAVRSCSFDWRVFVNEDGPRVVAVNEAVARVFDGSTAVRGRAQALNVTCRVVQTFRRKMYAPPEMVPSDYPSLIELARELRKIFVRSVDRKDLLRFTEDHRLTPTAEAPDVVPSLLPAYLEAGRYFGADLIGQAAACVREGDVPTAVEAEAIRRREFGYLRIRAFPLEDPEAGLFKYELRRLLNLLPTGGLILDVRDNPGGSTRLAEESLQFFTPNTITPVSFRFAATRVTRFITERDAERRGPFAEYAPSIKAALDAGREFSAEFPITEVRDANALGQHYFGPVILLTSGMTYSAGEIFAAGFVDNGIGPIIGVDETTGGGGGNCWFYNQFAAALLNEPVLPGGANLQVAARECTRIGEGDKQIEEAGVARTIGYNLTKEDVLGPQPWGLLLQAARNLSTRAAYDMAVVTVENGGTRALEVDVDGIDHLMVWINKEQSAVDVVGGRASVVLPSFGRIDLKIKGYSGSSLAACYLRVFRE